MIDSRISGSINVLARAVDAVLPPASDGIFLKSFETLCFTPYPEDTEKKKCEWGRMLILAFNAGEETERLRQLKEREQAHQGRARKTRDPTKKQKKKPAKRR